MSNDISMLAKHAQQCNYKDAQYFSNKIRSLKKIKDDNKKNEAIAALSLKVQKSLKTLEEKTARKISLNYPENLPVSQKIEDIVKAIKDNQVVVVAGETGSGKTTQLPKACLQAGLGRRGLIGHTQPRRLAARTVSKRIAEELGSTVGDLVGYQVRFSDQVSDSSLVKVMTDGILLNEIKFDKYLNQYEVIIIDEAHERSLNIDFLLGYLKKILAKRSELKLVITSATIDVERFSKFFDDAPIFTVSGRSYPVDINYRPPLSSDEFDLSLSEQIAQVVEEIESEEKQRKWPVGDVLVFLPGEREIREVSKSLKDYEFRNTEVLPLYARLSDKDQNRIFQSHAGRRIVLSTNVAETSLTVPGIRYVIDPGTVRISRYSYRSKIQRLPIEPVSQASANQRSGRCGRVAEGICYRLYDETDYLSRPEFTDPEILRTNLASVILKMLDSGMGSVYDFDFIDAPENKLWNDGFKLLLELEAVDSSRKLTKLGRKLATIPADPRLAKMLLKSSELDCLNEVLLIVSGLSIQDPRERPAEKQSAADQCHAVYKDADSDFIALLNLWNNYEIQRQELSNNQLKKYCQKHYLSFMRMREWREVHRQLHLVSKQLNLAENKTESNYESIHKSLLSGMLGNVGMHDEKREYVGCRNRRFMLSPGSSIVKKKPKWIFSAEIVETQKIYARMNARIEPDWIEVLSSHLVKKSWSEPVWQSKKGQVIAREKVTLYGLQIVNNRRVNFGVIDPKISREIFIRSGLVEGQYETRDKSLKHNKLLINQLEAIEDRTRRRDVVVDDERVYDLYDAVIPSNIVSGPSFEKWRKNNKDSEDKLLFSEADLKLSADAGFDPQLFPDYLENNGIKFPLSYQFNPGSQNDGINVSVPFSALKQLTVEKLERGVPGLLREKCTQLIKNLPRTLRKNFVPVPDVVERILPKIEQSDLPLLEALTKELRYLRGVEIPFESWKIELIEDHLRLNVQVVDDIGNVIEQGRDFVSVAEKVSNKNIKASKRIKEASKKVIASEWVFGEIDKPIEVTEAGIKIMQFPSLKDLGDRVELTYCLDRYQAENFSANGVARLLSFRVKDQVSLFPKEIKNYKQLGLLYAPVGQAKQLYNDFVIAAIKSYFLIDGLPSCKEAFDSLLEKKKAGFFDFVKQYSILVYDVLYQYHAIKKKLKGRVNLAIAMSLTDLQSQLDSLVYDAFLSNTPLRRLQEIPRYLKAADVRFEKMARDMANERRCLPILQLWQENYKERLKQHELQGVYDPNLEEFRWLIQEQRVSWFAQQLRTTETVSEKRLNKFWETVKR